MNCLKDLIYNPTSEKFINHLYEGLDGYIQVAHFGQGKAKIKNYRNMKVREAIDEYSGLKDIFITPNATFNGRRLIENIRQFRALYIDMDNKNLSFNDIVYGVWELANLEKIPYPTMVISSGRGCHLYWRIEHAPIQALATWQELEDYLYYQLKELGSDKKATDAARVLRLPGSINSRNGEECKIVILNDNITYSMYDLREQYLGWTNTKVKKIEVTEIINKKNVKTSVLQFFTSYTLHLARAEDILMICKLRNYKLTGYRNMIIHCYAYWLGVTHRDSESLAEMVNALNEKFTEPLKKTDIKAILRCVPKAIEKFLEYEQGIRSGEIKRVSKGMCDKGGYWYKNETLIELLNITLDEQRQLKTIISTEIKYERRRDKDNEIKKANRRNKKGLTKREQQKQETISVINELKAKGLSQNKVSKESGFSIALVKRYWNI
ncbi:MAG: DNA-binding response regulator [Clostridium sp.]